MTMDAFKLVFIPHEPHISHKHDYTCWKCYSFREMYKCILKFLVVRVPFLCDHMPTNMPKKSSNLSSILMLFHCKLPRTIHWAGQDNPFPRGRNGRVAQLVSPLSCLDSRM